MTKTQQFLFDCSNKVIILTQQFFAKLDIAIITSLGTVLDDEGFGLKVYGSSPFYKEKFTYLSKPASMALDSLSSFASISQTGLGKQHFQPTFRSQRGMQPVNNGCVADSMNTPDNRSQNLLAFVQ